MSDSSDEQTSQYRREKKATRKRRKSKEMQEQLEEATSALVLRLEAEKAVMAQEIAILKSNLVTQESIMNKILIGITASGGVERFEQLECRLLNALDPIISKLSAGPITRHPTYNEPGDGAAAMQRYVTPSVTPPVGKRSKKNGNTSGLKLAISLNSVKPKNQQGSSAATAQTDNETPSQQIPRKGVLKNKRHEPYAENSSDPSYSPPVATSTDEGCRMATRSRKRISSDHEQSQEDAEMSQDRPQSEPRKILKKPKISRHRKAVVTFNMTPTIH